MYSILSLIGKGKLVGCRRCSSGGRKKQFCSPIVSGLRPGRPSIGYVFRKDKPVLRTSTLGVECPIYVLRQSGAPPPPTPEKGRKIWRGEVSHRFEIKISGDLKMY